MKLSLLLFSFSFIFIIAFFGVSSKRFIVKTKHWDRFQAETRKQTKGLFRCNKDLPSNPKHIIVIFPVKVKRQNSTRRGLGNKSLKSLRKKLPKLRKKAKKNGSSVRKKTRNRSWFSTTPNPEHFESDAKSDDMYFDDDSITIFACHVSSV